MRSQAVCCVNGRNCESNPFVVGSSSVRRRPRHRYLHRRASRPHASPRIVFRLGRVVRDVRPGRPSMGYAKPSGRRRCGFSSQRLPFASGRPRRCYLRQAVQEEPGLRRHHLGGGDGTCRSNADCTSEPVHELEPPTSLVEGHAPHMKLRLGCSHPTRTGACRSSQQHVRTGAQVPGRPGRQTEPPRSADRSAVRSNRIRTGR